MAAEFARHDLMDEYRLYVDPIVIGRGTPMLRPSVAKLPLQPIETHTSTTGGRHVALRAASFEARQPVILRGSCRGSDGHRTTSAACLCRPVVGARNRDPFVADTRPALPQNAQPTDWRRVCSTTGYATVW
jgi:hypothetical protein